MEWNLLVEKSKHVILTRDDNDCLVWHEKGQIIGQIKVKDIIYVEFFTQEQKLSIFCLERKLTPVSKIEIRSRFPKEYHFESFYHFDNANNPNRSSVNGNFNTYIHSCSHHNFIDVFELYRYLSNEIEMELKNNTKIIRDLSERYLFGEDYIQYYDRPWNNRRFLIVTNPHGGNHKALSIYETIIKPLFDKIRLGADVVLTEYSGHAEDMGSEYDYIQYEGVLFISGDGTVNEFINGILSTPHARDVLRNTIIGVIPAGTENSLARGIGTNDIYTALYCIIKRLVRPFDSICVTNGSLEARYCFAGCAWGIVSDMVQDYENYRCLGRARYWYLKGIHGCFCRRKHRCELRYIPAGNQIRRKCKEKYPNCLDCYNYSKHPCNIIPPLPTSTLGSITSNIHTIPSPIPIYASSTIMKNSHGDNELLNNPFLSKKSSSSNSQLNKERNSIPIENMNNSPPAIVIPTKINGKSPINTSSSTSPSAYVPLYYHPLIKARNKLLGWDRNNNNNENDDTIMNDNKKNMNGNNHIANSTEMNSFQYSTTIPSSSSSTLANTTTKDNNKDTIYVNNNKDNSNSVNNNNNSKSVNNNTNTSIPPPPHGPPNNRITSNNHEQKVTQPSSMHSTSKGEYELSRLPAIPEVQPELEHSKERNSHEEKIDKEKEKESSLPSQNSIPNIPPTVSMSTQNTKNIPNVSNIMKLPPKSSWDSVQDTVHIYINDLSTERERETKINSLLKMYPPAWIEEEGYYHTLAIARKGTCVDDVVLALRYVIGDEFGSKQMDYFKVYAVEIESYSDPLIMLDGEMFRGPCPIRFTCVPSLLTVFGEY
ncbi:hypothetical protein WA158_006438 [Blastocystis sp. Blastoise]